jgi:hypothetical protein
MLLIATDLVRGDLILYLATEYGVGAPLCANPLCVRSSCQYWDDKRSMVTATERPRTEQRACVYHEKPCLDTEDSEIKKLHCVDMQ